MRCAIIAQLVWCKMIRRSDNFCLHQVAIDAINGMEVFIIKAALPLIIIIIIIIKACSG